VGAPEYVPNDDIKEFTLHARCQEIANYETISKLKERLDLVQKL